VPSDDNSSRIPERIQLDAQRGETYPALVATMQRLLAPDGCPWDREQTEQTLKRYVLEEACEVIDAIDSGDPSSLCDELGDLSLQVVFLAELGRRRGAFGPDDVVRAIVEKLVRRHPHVFGSVHVENADEVVANWNEIKVKEKGKKKLLDGLPRALPALYRAQRIGERVAKVGFDWEDESGSFAKVREEVVELEHAVADEPRERVEAEFGDLFLALVNYARHLGIDAEEALRKSTDRFDARFRQVEARVEERHGGWPGKDAPPLELEELDRYWEDAKREERKRMERNEP
jgi:tetrapyrrole methylase family protein/MazG family protein/ATP diphosphatase